MIAERVLKRVQAALPGSSVQEQTLLISSGLLDSLALIDLITALEREFLIKFTNDELLPDNFDSASAILRLISGKLGASGK